MRASGAPKQKWAAHPKATWRLSAAEVEPIGIGEALGIAVGGAHHRDDRLPLADQLVAQPMSSGASRAVCWLGLS